MRWTPFFEEESTLRLAEPSRGFQFSRYSGLKIVERYQTQVPHGLYLVKSLCCTSTEIAEVAQVSREICDTSQPNFVSLFKLLIYIYPRFLLSWSPNADFQPLFLEKCQSLSYLSVPRA